MFVKWLPVLAVALLLAGGLGSTAEQARAADGEAQDREPPRVLFRSAGVEDVSDHGEFLLNPRSPQWQLELNDSGDGFLENGWVLVDVWQVSDRDRRLLDTHRLVWSEGASTLTLPLPAMVQAAELPAGTVVELAVYTERSRGPRGALAGRASLALDDAAGGDRVWYHRGPIDAAGNATGPVVIRSFVVKDGSGIATDGPGARRSRLTPASSHVLAVTNGRVGPNPFVPAAGNARVYFDLSENAEVSVRAYDWNGDFVDAIFEGVLFSGSNSVEWGGQTEDGRKLGNGVYLVRIEAKTQARIESAVVKVAVWNER